ncbi:MAG: hypothetical protein JRG96_01135 [Deltaproteobacteria bacterium]|nr:hypothetical protein [Deltaproteobacteria bacterium]MBW2417324.1 hypothetical protein [Deltaproteobacteria bacterium]
MLLPALALHAGESGSVEESEADEGWEYEEWVYEEDAEPGAEEAEESEAAATSNPPYQEFWVSLGLRYDDSRTVRQDLVPRSQGLVIDTRASAFDERTLGGHRYRTLGNFQADTTLDDLDLSYQVLSAFTGPVFDLAPDTRLHASLGGEVSFYGGSFFSGLAALYLSAESIEESWLSAYELAIGVERIDDTFLTGADAVWGSLWATFATHQLLAEVDHLDLTPGVSYYYADEERLRYAQAELTLRYGGPFHERLSGTLWLTGWRRWYVGSEVGVEGDRRDWFLDVGAGVTVWELLLSQLALELIYEYEQNWSNDSFEDNRGHSIGFLFHWGF